jgi:hypothetical protein
VPKQRLVANRTIVLVGQKIGTGPCAIAPTDRVLRRAWTGIRLTGSLRFPAQRQVIVIRLTASPRGSANASLVAAIRGHVVSIYLE